MDHYRLGDVTFGWESQGYSLLPGVYAERFRCLPGEDGIRLSGAFGDLTPYINAPLVRSQGFYRLHLYEGEPVLLYSWGRLHCAFAVFPHRIDAGRADVCVLDPRMAEQAAMSADWFFGVCGLHRALLHRDMPIFHASYIDCGGEAILFAAPSQTGKSTQAELWRQHAGAQVVNGDRVLLGKREGRWYAHGYPCCGSSDICVDRSLPIRAIVVLEQGKENRIGQLNLAAKLRCLAAGMGIYSWDSWEVDRAFALAEDISAQVPVVKLVCRPDAQAVETLREYLGV